MKKTIALLLSALMLLSLLAGCSGKTEEQPTKPESSDATAANSETSSSNEAASDVEASSTTERKELTMWFWGTSDYQRTAMEKYLVEGFNASQDEYTLSVEYRASVDNDITVALSGGGGPDIIYGSGPAFVAGYAAQGLFLNLDSYSEQYGWKDRLVDAYYDLCSTNGSLYSLPGGLSGIGVFYNAKLLEENGWGIPTTYDELVAVMDQAIAKGLHGGIIGAKDWRYTNDWPVSMLFTSVAGPEAVYKCLTGEQKWNSPEIVAATEELVNWYNAGYFGGDDYWNVDANESCQMLLDGGTPFFFAPLNGFQWLRNVAASEEQLADIGYMPMPSKRNDNAAVMLGSVCTFSINAKSENPDGAAAVMDYMLTSDFAANMSAEWPGYWGLPLKNLEEMDTSSFSSFSAQYMKACTETISALNSGSFGYMASGCFPAMTYETCIDIDTVWLGSQSVSDFLDAMDTAYAEDVAAGSVIPVPQPNF